MRRRHLKLGVAAVGSIALGVTLVLRQPSPACSYRAGGALPDPVCTPGATNPDVTQETIDTTICVPGWTATIRPPAAYTNALKRQQMVEYGFTGNPADYEEDHWIPLELGGHPSDPLNLWPERWTGADGAHAKDRVENLLHARVCAGTMTLADAQQAIRTDWWQVR